VIKTPVSIIQARWLISYLSKHFSQASDNILQAAILFDIVVRVAYHYKLNVRSLVKQNVKINIKSLLQMYGAALYC
jgi:hypothetical protein